MREVDFTPDWYIQRVRERRGSRGRITGMLVIGGLVAIWYVHSVSLASAAGQEVARLRKCLVVQQSLAGQLDRYDRELADATAKERVVNNLGGGIMASQVIAEVTRLMPATMTLQSVRLHRSARLSPGELTEEQAVVLARDMSVPEVTTLEIAGWAASGINVGEFVSALGESPLFANVKMRYQRAEVHFGREVVAFEIVAMMPQFE